MGERVEEDLDPFSFHFAVTNRRNLSRSDPWQTKFNLLCQDIRNIKANKYVSIRQANNKYNHTASSVPDKDKHPPMDRHVRGGQDGTYYEGNRTEHSLRNTLDTPTHCDSTRCDASQVPLRMPESPPMSPSDPPSSGSPGSPNSSTSESGMADNAVPNEYPEISTSSIAMALPCHGRTPSGAGPCRWRWREYESGW